MRRLKNQVLEVKINYLLQTDFEVSFRKSIDLKLSSIWSL